MQLQVGVKITLKRKDGKILLLKRSNAYGKKLVGQWDLIGGRINPGVNLYNNLLREIKEETGINYRGKTELILAQDIIRPDKHVVRLTFTGKFQTNPKIILDKENTEYRWFTTKEMQKLGMSLDKYVRELLKKDLIS